MDSDFSGKKVVLQLWLGGQGQAFFYHLTTWKGLYMLLFLPDLTTVMSFRSFTSQSVEHALTPSLAETETYSSIFIFLFIMYMSMLQPVMSHEPYNSLLSLLSTRSTDWLVWSSYLRTQMSTNQYVAPCTNTLFSLLFYSFWVIHATVLCWEVSADVAWLMGWDVEHVNKLKTPQWVLENMHAEGGTSLTRNTVADLDSQVKHKGKVFVAFSITTDKSTDITDLSQLAILIHGVDETLSSQRWTGSEWTGPMLSAWLQMVCYQWSGKKAGVVKNSERKYWLQVEGFCTRRHCVASH